ncbi:Cof-type HAD-IIB family hydrolase [Paenibacillus tyrfis]|uniref:Cof-type HAD-IIB family hydrolase n=1 Tax=Paenibacillus tyrfis TaxID=1501230 RepID=UPI000B58D5B6|nr:Cof-type HAD-IIB family hydrolase [Paenibacillus tyrfis]
MKDRRFEGYLLVTDMNGTLLDSAKQISGENRAAIERFTSLGGRFTLATGRIAGSVRPFVEQLPVNTPAILYNGAVIHDFSRGEAIWERTLSASAKEAVGRVLERFPGIGAELYVRGGAAPYVLQENETTERHRAVEKFPLLRLNSYDDVSEPWIKLLFAWEPSLLDEAVPEIVRLTAGTEVDWVRSDDKYFEMLAPEATKGHALERLAAELGIPMERCIALGDHLNDLEMIRRAGIGIAVANAHPELLDAAKRHGKHHNEHAIADVIEWLEEQVRQGTLA